MLKIIVLFFLFLNNYCYKYNEKIDNISIANVSRRNDLKMYDSKNPYSDLDYELIEDQNNYYKSIDALSNSLSTEGVVINSEKKDIYETIISNKKISIDGYILKNNRKLLLNDYYNFDNFSRFEIVNWLKCIGIFNEEEKVILYEKLLDIGLIQNTICLNSYVDQISDYYLERNLNSAKSMRSYENFTENCNDYYVSSNFYILFNRNSHDFNCASIIANYIEFVRETYKNMGFINPICEDEYSKLRVVLSPDKVSNISGFTSYYDHTDNGTRNTSHSLIVLYGVTSLTDNLKEVIAHEYFHAIKMLIILKIHGLKRLVLIGE